jgi:probable phosphoglycerate mutase
MTRFSFVRHGQTDWNRWMRFQGQADPPLNATGMDQATRLARRLLAQEPPPDLLISSDLQRARQTAQPLVDGWGCPLQLDAGFREQSFGCLEGLTAEQVQAQYPQLWQGWLTQAADFALPDGGESLASFSARVLGRAKAWAQAQAADHIMVVTHGGVLDMLWRAAHRLPLDGLRQCEIPNTGINRLRWVDGVLEIETWADAAHLSEAAAKICRPPADSSADSA